MRLATLVADGHSVRYIPPALHVQQRPRQGQRLRGRRRGSHGGEAPCGPVPNLLDRPLHWQQLLQLRMGRLHGLGAREEGGEALQKSEATKLGLLYFATARSEATSIKNIIN